MIRRRALLPLAAAVAGPGRARAVQAGGYGRIACAGSALTETVCALGQGGRLVAVDSSSGFPAAETARLPRIGYYRALPTEGLVSLAPDLVLLSSDAGPPGVIAVLREAGLPIRVIEDGVGPGAAEAKARAVAAAIGVDGERLADAIAADWAALDAPIAALPRPRVLFVLSLSRGAPLVGGRDTHADAAIAAAGGVNCAHEIWSGYRPLAAESAAGLAPDVVLMMQQSLAEAGGVAEVAAAPAIAVTPAGQAGRIIGMDGPYLMNFGPRAAHSRRDLALRLHPGLALPPLPARPWIGG
ncbi:heme/hemin ABC transporter substrate-binding protein [Roseicella frigidaeris]|uniref:heme/hemin ABC transporter substrate-binding protein n=1 Tax=Roseicella frigidaeris TaxID=2230885 RepID=UPI0014024855|nr:ABC transporter substrate-binding protein [Roseicella frigidaeris]